MKPETYRCDGRSLLRRGAAKAIVPAGAAGALVGAFLAFSPGARAYEWYETPGGEPMRWFSPATRYHIATVAPEEIAVAELPGLFDRAFAAWMDLPGCRVPEVSYAGPQDVTRATTPSSLDEVADNVMVFVPDTAQWRARGHAASWIAITLIANDSATGEIVDADMEINDGAFAFSIDDAIPQGRFDLVSTLTHEAGHFFGMDHSPVPGATMLATYQGHDGSDPTQARTLDADDRDGVCALYETLPPCPQGCDDGDRCTVDTCRDDVCVHTPDDACADGGGCAGGSGAGAGGVVWGELGALAAGWVLAMRAVSWTKRRTR